MPELGVAFRSTVGYVTDGANDSMPSESAASATYPETLANGLTVGWEAMSSGVDSRDRSTSVNVRLAGLHFNLSSTEQVLFRIDVSAVAHDIRAAFGEPTYGPGDAYFQFRDNTTAFATIDHSGGNPAGQWYDASDVLRTSSALWVSNNVRISRTFSSSILRLAMGRGAGGTGSCVVAYLSVEAGASAPSAVSSRRAKSLIHPGAGPGGFGARLRTRRHNIAPSTLETIIGTLAQTLDDVTLAAAGVISPREGSRRGKTPIHPGAGPYNLLRFNRTRRNTVVVTPSLTGTLAVTLDDVTLAAQGTTTVTGSLAQTLAGVTLAAQGTTTVTGTLAQTLAGVTLAAQGTTTVVGSLAQTLADATLAASGSVGSAVDGTLAVTLASTTLAAQGTTTIVGALSQTLSGVTLAAQGTTTVTGTLAQTLAGVTLSAQGTTTVKGTLAQTLENATLAATGAAGTPTGTLAVTLDNVTLSASGVGAPASNGANDSSRKRKPHSSIYTVQERGQQAHDKALVEAAIAETEAAPAPIKAAKVTQSSPVNQAQEAAYAAALRQLEDDEEAFSLIMELV